MNSEENRSEEIFARLCASAYYGGFVYRNPKYFEPTEKEAGDVILWVRDWLIIFEIVWRSTEATRDTKSFVKRIGQKRDQLLSDFKVYANDEITINMKNEDGELTQYDFHYSNERTTRGVVLIDAPSLQGKLHFDTLRLTTEAPHPIAIMTRTDFEAILSEVDTASDLGLYLGDRHAFLKEVLHADPRPFLQLGDQLEQELIGLYKLGENKFDVDRWKKSADKRFWRRYQTHRREDIARRDQENAQSAPIDGLMSEIRKLHGSSAGAFTIQHAWELALRTRRERAVLAGRIEKKIHALADTGREQKFAAKNGTGCWDVFYFYQGSDSEYFEAEAQRMADRKMWIERSVNGFEYSVFCFAIRYSSETPGAIIEVVLTVSDASKCPDVTPAMLSEAREYFAGQTAAWPVLEFPQA